MDNWINKIGFPVLTVTEKADRITVRQDRYLETGDVKDEENRTLWYASRFLIPHWHFDGHFIVGRYP
jgi:aminopeptidase 2